MLAARDRHAPIGLELGVAVQLVRHHRLLQPAQVEGLEPREHALGVVQRPAHVGVGHDVDPVAHRFADGAHQVQVPLDARGPVHGPPAEAQLHGLVAFLLVALRLRGQLLERHAVQAARIDRDARLGAAAQQAVDGLPGRLAEQVPERDVERADGDHADPLATEGHRLAVHELPEELQVPRVGPQQERLQVDVDHLLRDAGGEGCVADADEAVVAHDLHHQPAMEGEGAHGGFRQREQVHGVRAEVRRQRDRLAPPLHDACADLLDLHATRSGARPSGSMRGMARQMTAKARTWNDPARANTRP